MNSSYKNIFIVMIMQVCTPLLVASTLPKAGQLVGKALASQVAQQHFQSMPCAISTMNSAAAYQFRPLSQNTHVSNMKISKNSLSIPKFIPTKNESNSDLFKWLVLGGLAVATDLTMQDEKFDFESIDMNDIPNFKNRIAYLKYQLKDMEIEPEIDFDVIGLSLVGNNYKALQALTLYYKQEASRNNRLIIIQKDIEEVFLDVTIGEFNHNRLKTLSRKDLLENSYHESGHALLAALFLREIRIVNTLTIRPRGEIYFAHIGFMDNVVFKNSSEKFMYHLVHEAKLQEMHIAMLLAGGITEQFPKDRQFTEDEFRKFLTIPGIVGDVQDAIKIAVSMAEKILYLEQFWSEYESVFSEIDIESKFQEYELNKNLYGLHDYPISKKAIEKKAFEILNDVFKQTIQLLNLHRDELDQIAKSLYKKGTILGKDVYDILDIEMPLLDFQYNRELAAFEKDLPEYQ